MTCLTLFDMDFFRQPSGGMVASHHNFVVITPMTTKFGTYVKIGVFYATITKNLTSLGSRNYDVITCT